MIFTINKSCDYGIIESIEVRKRPIDSANFFVVNLLRNNDDKISSFELNQTALERDFGLTPKDFGIEKLIFLTEDYNNANVLKWCKSFKNETLFSDTEKKGYSPCEVQRVLDGKIFKIGDSIKYPNIHLSDVYPILRFRIETLNFYRSPIKEILINNHLSCNTLRSINNWEKV